MYNTEYYNTLASVSTTQGSWCMLYAHNYGADLSHYVSNAHTLLLFYTLVYNILCPKCIYTYTLYGLFTNATSSIYHHHYYCYNNNSRTIKQSTHCFRLFDCRLSEQSDLPRLQLSAPRSYQLSANPGLSLPPPTGGTYSQQM